MKFTHLFSLKMVSGIRFIIAALAGFSMLSLGSCQEEIIRPDPERGEIIICPPHDNNSTACTPETYVTVRDMVCATGVWGSLWLQLDNGDYLQPWTSDVPMNLLNGQRFKINYQQVNYDNRYDTAVICMALIALPPSTPIHINCMEPEQGPPSSDCSVLVTADDVLCGYGVWGAMYLELPDGTHLQPWETTVNLQNIPMLEDGDQYKIGYEVMQPDNRYDSVYVCLALPPDVYSIQPARITCIEKVSANQ